SLRSWKSSVTARCDVRSTRASRTPTRGARCTRRPSRKLCSPSTRRASAGPECSPILPAVLIAGDAGAFVDGAWKSTALGDCAMALEGDSASVRAVLSDETLFLEVTDDAFVTRGAVVDAIEVVSESEAAMPGEHPRHETLAMDGTF